MIGEIARKERMEMRRDGRIRSLGGVIAMLTVAALLFGAVQTERAEHDRSHAEERAETQWENQGDKNPHVAAHYGTHVFAPTTVMTAMDPGVSAYLGRSVRVEAHKRNLAANAGAEDGGGISRLGTFSVTRIWLLLVPLLIIAMGYGLWGLERERGTLRQVLSTGVSRGHLYWGKWIALSTAIGALVIPSAALIALTLSILGGGTWDTALRMAALLAGYLLYFGIFIHVTLWLSASLRESRGALVGLIGFWVVLCLILPRGATEWANQSVPLPSEAQLQRDIDQTLETGPDGTQEREEAVEEFISQLMDERGMANVGLMVDQSVLNGIELRAEALWEDLAYDTHMERLAEKTAAQEAAAAQGGWLSPYVAMMHLSAGLAGTDFAHHHHFTSRVELWRKEFVTYLNEAFAEKSGNEGWNYKADAEVWKNAPPFTYSAPSIQLALQTHGGSFGALLLWFILTGIGAHRAAQRVKVVVG